MTKKLYVAGLPIHFTGYILENLFSAYGTVESATVIVDRITDLSRGFGFVEMSTESEARRAIRNLNGAEFEGQTIKVREAALRPVPFRSKSIRHNWYARLWTDSEPA